jgi:hypothetical protein
MDYQFKRSNPLENSETSRPQNNVGRPKKNSTYPEPIQQKNGGYKQRCGHNRY